MKKTLISAVLALILCEVSFSQNITKVDINRSIIQFIGKGNSWRTNIESILSTKDNKIFLVKEIRSETVGKYPFSNFQKKYEFLGIVEDKKTHFIRTSATDGNKGNIQFNSSIKNKKYIVKNNVNYLNFEQVFEIVSSGKNINIFCEIEYEYEGAKYNLVAKIDYINFSNNKNEDKYLQPVIGYVPFILNNTIRHGYASFNINQKKNGFLEFLLNEKSGIFHIDQSENLLKIYIKKIFNTFLFFYKRNDFTELVSIKESRINFFIYK